RLLVAGVIDQHIVTRPCLAEELLRQAVVDAGPAGDLVLDKIVERVVGRLGLEEEGRHSRSLAGRAGRVLRHHAPFTSGSGWIRMVMAASSDSPGPRTTTPVPSQP